MYKAYKYRIYPTVSQQVLLAKTFGCVRYFWNMQVATFNSYNKDTNPSPTYKSSTEVRNDLDWMKEVSAAAIQQKGNDFNEYKKQMFSKTRKKAIGFPSFKKKSNRQSYRLPIRKFSIKNEKIRLEKIGYVAIVIDRVIPVDAKYMSVTVSMNPRGQYFASVLVDQIMLHKQKTGKEVGIDVGLKEFLVQSDNLIVNNPRYFHKSQVKLAKIQICHSKKVKGSRRSKKSRFKIARLHNKIANQRSWFLHNESTRIVRDYDKICIEDLNISEMIKNHDFAKSISDVSWSKFYSMLKYKAKWHGKEVAVIGRYEPTSKTCSGCGWVNSGLTLKDRVFKCPECGLELDRDLNAAINIKALGVNSAIRTTHDDLSRD